jgi:outer membrane protein OmpA-like peptidoglycan-associated protein
VGHGENNALEDNKTDGGRAMNRRIVFKTIK